MKFSNVLLRGISRCGVRTLSSVTLRTLRVEQVCKLLDHCNLGPLKHIVKKEDLTGAILATAVNFEVDLTAVGLKPLHARALLRHLQEWKSEGLPAGFCATVLQSLIEDFSRAYCNDKTAVERLRQVADAGNHIAQGYLSVLYIDEIVQVTSNEGSARMYAMQALPQLQVDADKGCPYANYLLAVCANEGVGIWMDDAAKFSRFKLAADVGNVGAIRKLGWCYDQGVAVSCDKAEAFRLYNKAADLGDPIAQFNLGVCYEDGEGVSENVSEARRYYALAAAQGYEEAKDALDALDVTEEEEDD